MKESNIRWVVLALSTIMLLSIYYCYDIPSSLKMQLFSYMNSSSNYEVEFGLLYSFYSFPNVILPLCAGALVDKFGASICLLIFCLIYCGGQLLFTIGIAQKSWWLMDSGRFFLGFGGEAFKVANYALLPDFFRPNELSFVNAIASLSRFGNVLVNLITPNLATRYSLLIALIPGIGLCSLAFLSVILLQFIKKQSTSAYQPQEYELVRNPMNRSGSTDADDDLDDIPEIDTILDTINDEETDDETTSSFSSHGSRLKKSPPTSDRLRNSSNTTTVNHRANLQKCFQSCQFDLKYWLLLCSAVLIYGCMGPFNNIASTVLLERDFFKPIPASCTLIDPRHCQDAINTPSASCPAEIRYQLPLPTNYSIYTPLLPKDIDCTSSFWKVGCTASYCERLNAAIQETSFVMSIPFMLFACTAVPLGKLIDRIGHRLEFLLLGVIIFLLTHLLLATTDVNALVLMIGQGLGNVLFITTYWPLLPLIVEKKFYGTAYGLAMSLQNVTYVVLPYVLALVFNGSHNRYIPNVEYCFVAISFLAAFPILVLLFNRTSLNFKL